MEYIELLMIILVAYSGISPNVSASLKVLEDGSFGGIDSCDGCDFLHRYCDVAGDMTCGACKPGYHQKKIRERYSQECFKNANSDDSVIDSIANSRDHSQSDAGQAEPGSYGKYNLHKLLRKVQNRLHQNSREQKRQQHGLPDPDYSILTQQFYEPPYQHSLTQESEAGPDYYNQEEPPKPKEEYTHNHGSGRYEHDESDTRGHHQEGHHGDGHQDSHHGDDHQDSLHGDGHQDSHHRDGHQDSHHGDGHQDSHHGDGHQDSHQGDGHQDSRHDVTSEEDGHHGDGHDGHHDKGHHGDSLGDSQEHHDGGHHGNKQHHSAHEQPTAARQQQGRDHVNTLADQGASMSDVYFLAVVAACSIAGVVGLLVAGVCWYRLQKNVTAASEAEYPAYGVTGPTTKEPGPGSPGDRKLAHSAQMYHYQHQKQQMLAMEKASGDINEEEDESEEENEEGDYTVYECPGLAPTGEMEVKNPLFSEETPVTPSGGDDRNGQK